MRDAELTATLAEQVGATFASVQPPLREVLVRSIEGHGIAVASEQVHDDELNLQIKMCLEDAIYSLSIDVPCPSEFYVPYSWPHQEFGGGSRDELACRYENLPKIPWSQRYWSTREILE